MKKTLGEFDLSGGILQFLLNGFYKIHPEAFPYKMTIRTLLKALEWPEVYEYKADYPKAAAPGWTDNLEGVTNDGTNWYFTQDIALWEIPPIWWDTEIDRDALPKGMYVQGIPHELKNYNHIGDLDYWVRPEGGTFLFVPFENQDLDPPLEGAIALYKTDGSKPPIYLGSTNLGPSPHPQAPWCAVNPLNGLLYTSDFHTNSLYVYKISFISNTTSGISGLELLNLGNFQLKDELGNPISLYAIQGGVFSKNGHLYLVSDKGYSGPAGHDDDEVINSGIFGFDMITGRRIKKIYVPYIPELPDFEELQGITIWNREDVDHIHLIMLDNEKPDDDDLYFKHWKVSEKDVDKI